MERQEPGWDLYRTFLAVLRDGSLSRAARTLGLTQPTAGRHVDALEAALGLQLFTRSQHGLEPTEAALDLKPHAEAMAATAAALVRTASGAGGGIRGSVRVSASDVVGAEVLPPILASLRERHPGLVIELVLSNSIDDLLRRDADIAVRMVEPTQGALLVRWIGDIALGFHARSDYLARRGTPRTLGDLEGHTVIGFDRPSPWIRDLLRTRPDLDPRIFALRTDNDIAQFSAIRTGCGIGVCQAPLARREGLVRVLEDTFELRLKTYVVMHEDLRSTARCRAAFDALVEGLLAYVRGGAGRGA